MLKIGDFARLGRVTVKALRHDEEEGLLKPRDIDPATGYRYYAPEQLAWIVLLKDFGFRVGDPSPARPRSRAPSTSGGRSSPQRLTPKRDGCSAFRG